MPSDSDGPPLLAYVEMVWRRRLLVLLIAAGMVLPAVAISFIQTPTYRAGLQILLVQPEVDLNFNIETAALTEVQVNTQIALITSEDVGARARVLGATSGVSATGKANSNVITIFATSSDPQQAAASATAYAKAYTDFRTDQIRKALDEAGKGIEGRIGVVDGQLVAARSDNERRGLEDQRTTLEEQAGRLRIQREIADSGVTVVQAAQPPSSPESPNPVRDGLLALVIGLVLGVSVAVLLETMKRRSSHNTQPIPTVPPEPPGPPARRNGRPLRHAAADSTHYATPHE
jgi:polysaccharide biosynthesis transport protein